MAQLGCTGQDLKWFVRTIAIVHNDRQSYVLLIFIDLGSLQLIVGQYMNISLAKIIAKTLVRRILLAGESLIMAVDDERRLLMTSNI